MSYGPDVDDPRDRGHPAQRRIPDGVAIGQTATAGLLDSGHKVRDLFRLHGVPQSFVYNREGRLVAESISGLTIYGFLEILGQAGLQ
jgi:hypothetical protein